MQELYVLLSEAKGIIFASPVYNGGVSAQIKAVMDRTRALLAGDKNVFKGKVGMGIAVGGDRNGGQEFALMQIHSFYIINGMMPVGGGFFGANLGATFWSKDTLDGVKSDEEGFRSLKKTVKRFADCMEKDDHKIGDFMAETVKVKKRKVAWGITGAGDKIAEIVEDNEGFKKAIRRYCRNRGLSFPKPPTPC